jgi:hypothetical protein
MAKYSQKMMGKEVGAASVYAKPHTMQGKSLAIKPETGAKTTGIKIRGTGAATKGVMARGPMG